jgi:hypothetical protein
MTWMEMTVNGLGSDGKGGVFVFEPLSTNNGFGF